MASRLGSFALAATVAAILPAGCSGSSVEPGGSVATQTGVHHASESYCPVYPGGTGILPDGDFSQAVQPGGNGDVTYRRGESFAPSWEVSKGNIDFLSVAYWKMDGLCSVDLDGDNTVGGVKTARFQTQDGNYTVSFVMSGNGDCAPTVKSMRLSVDGTHQHESFRWDTSNGHNVRNGDYASESWNFQAGSSAVLQFKSEDPRGSGCGIVIAGIGVTQL